MSKVVHDYRKLKGKIVEVFDNPGDFCRAMDLSSASYSRKINNRSDWKQDEIERSVVLLGLSVNDIPDYFFTPRV